MVFAMRSGTYGSSSQMAVTVLIVDDDQAVRGTVRRLLEREPRVRVVGEAGDGEEAVRLARELHPDVVLMDIAMPRLDGLEATRRIKAERPEAKVIILTVHREEAYRRAAGESGADAFLAKKAAEDLLYTIREFAPLASSEAKRTVGELRVLIAEEKALAAVRLKALLERLGHRVVGVAHDGKDAVEATWILEPDLIIVDIRLPVIDGIEAARTILRQRAIPIIVLTAYLSADLGPRAREAGAMAYLVKPVNARQLRSTIKLALARFGELEALREEASNLGEAWETRKLVERAKSVLMKELKISEGEAFRRIQHHRQGTNKSFQAIASTIVKADELLVRRLNFAQCLRAIHRAIRPGLHQVFPMTEAATM